MTVEQEGKRKGHCQETLIRYFVGKMIYILKSGLVFFSHNNNNNSNNNKFIAKKQRQSFISMIASCE